MEQVRVQELRAACLSKLNLPNSDVTEHLVTAFRRFLKDTEQTIDRNAKSKPTKRKSAAIDFLHSKSHTGGTNKRYFWPAAENQVSESEILQQLSDFMLLDVGGIPRHLSEAVPQSTSTSKPRMTPSHPDSQESGDPELAAARRVMDKLEEQDPTWGEPGSDFVQDTSRETRQVSKSISKSPTTQQQTLAVTERFRGLASPPSKPQLLQTSKSISSHVQRSANTEQLRTPPQSDKCLGKRPAIAADPVDISDDDLGKTSIWNISPRQSLPTESRKRARLGTTLQNRERDDRAAQSATIMTEVPFSDKARRQLEKITTPEKQTTPTRDPDAMQDFSRSTLGSPPRTEFESFFPPDRIATADAAVQCQITEPTAQSSLSIVIDIQALEPAQLFDLPCIFLDRLSECRKAHERIVTNESRLRALALGETEADLRKKLKVAEE